MPESKFDDRTLIPAIHLLTRGAAVFDSSDFKRKKNLVLFFLTYPEPRFFLQAEESAARLRAQNAELFVILDVSLDAVEAIYRRNRLTFAILSDPKREVFSKFLSIKDGEAAAALFITDRFGDIFFQHVAFDPGGLPPFEDIAKSLEFIESQCPECSGGLA